MTVAEQVVPIGTWRADALHSSVRFEVEHLGLSAFRAGFTEFDAGLDSDGHRSDAVRREADELVVEGDITIKGETRRVEARGHITDPITDLYGNVRSALTLETKIDRTDFGIGWQMSLPGGGQALANEIKLVVSLEMVKQP